MQFDITFLSSTKIYEPSIFVFVMQVTIVNVCALLVLNTQTCTVIHLGIASQNFQEKKVICVHLLVLKLQ